MSYRSIGCEARSFASAELLWAVRLATVAFFASRALVFRRLLETRVQRFAFSRKRFKSQFAAVFGSHRPPESLHDDDACCSIVSKGVVAIVHGNPGVFAERFGNCQAAL